MKSTLIILTSVCVANAFVVPTHPHFRSFSWSALKADDNDNDKKDLAESLWGKPPEDKKNNNNSDKSMSIALPFIARPQNLDGTLPGDVGFDPFGLSGSDKQTLMYMREAEIKHGRLAMLAVVGWPMAELLDKSIAKLFGLPNLLTKSGESPSILNGGLDKINPFYWAIAFSVGALVEYDAMKKKEADGDKYLVGDCGYDVLSLMPEEAAGKKNRQTSELKHGRTAMMAILGFAVQEALYNVPVVMETPQFFHPIGF